MTEPLTVRRIRRAMMREYALDDWHQHRVDRHNFQIFVGVDPRHEATTNDEVGVEHMMADRLDLNLAVLSSISRTKPILITLSSCGGEWDAGMQMMGAILACPNPVTVVATRWARSMTSLIPLAADKFMIRPPAQYMFHHGTAEFSGLAGEELDTWKRQCDMTRQVMLDLYVDRLQERGSHSRKSPANIRAMLEERMRRQVDVWLSADEAVRWGFVDDVFTGTQHRATKRNMVRRDRVSAVLRRVTVGAA
jgi:ATP-dependent protease ClpP protease subunit